MGRSVFEALGVPRETAQSMANAFDRMDRQSMIDLAGAYDPAIPPSQNSVYVEAVKEIRGPRTEELNREMTEIRAGSSPIKAQDPATQEDGQAIDPGNSRANS